MILQFQCHNFETTSDIVSKSFCPRWEWIYINIKTEFDFTDFATKNDAEETTNVDTSEVAKFTDIMIMKTEAALKPLKKTWNTQATSVTTKVSILMKKRCQKWYY